MRTAAVAGLAYFALVFAVGVVLGVARAALLAPWVGELAAVAIELPAILGAAWLASGWCVRRWTVPERRRFRLLMGAVAFALLMAAELILSSVLAGRDPAAHLASYREAGRLLGLLGQVVFALLPWLQIAGPGARPGGD